MGVRRGGRAVEGGGPENRNPQWSGVRIPPPPPPLIADCRLGIADFHSASRDARRGWRPRAVPVSTRPRGGIATARKNNRTPERPNHRTVSWRRGGRVAEGNRLLSG